MDREEKEAIMDREVKEAIREEREKIKQKAIDTLWNTGWTEEEIGIAISKSPKYVENIRNVRFLGSGIKEAKK